MRKDWLHLTITVEPQLLEPLSDFLVGVFDAGVEEIAPGEAGHGELQSYVEITGQDDGEIRQLIARIGTYLKEIENLFGAAPSKLSYKPLADQDWSKAWKEHFTPFTIIPGLTIAPSWDAALLSDTPRIVMDPGMAFGTGHHPTTRLSLELLCDFAKSFSSPSLLDVGTGTGILAMAGVLVGGCKNATGIDNDPEAIRCARENIALNGLEQKIVITESLPGSMEKKYQLIVANIVHDTLEALADDLSRLVAVDGVLILSGLHGKKQLESIKDIFRQRGLIAARIATCEKWSAVAFLYNKAAG